MLREEFLLAHRKTITRMAILLNKINSMPHDSLLALAPENELIKLKAQIIESDWKISESALNELILEECSRLS